MSNDESGKRDRRGAKLTEAAVRDIRRNHRKTIGEAGKRSLDFAEKYGVTCGTINNALNKVTWKDV